MAHPDFDILLNALLPLARELLEKDGTLHPFGRAVASDGRVLKLETASSGAPPSTAEAVAALQTSMQAMARRGEIRASGVCFDALVGKPGSRDKREAICARLEHRSGEAIDAFLPYERRGATIAYEALFAGAGEKVVFPGT
jgi:hypothetical protein